ncbi:YbfB/YjiJ family MFS transporter, partial [Salmonella enterica subsp. enterica serovar Oslo]
DRRQRQDVYKRQLLMPARRHAIAPMPLAKTEQQIMSWWLLAILYGLAGFGYIIVATYLPLMAKDAGSPLLTAHLWTLVGLSIVPLSLIHISEPTR